MKPQTIILYGIGLLQTVIGLKAFEPPGNSLFFPTCARQDDANLQQGCVSKCWDNSKYVSTCVKANETQCLCEDAEFQSVCVPLMSPSILSTLLINFRWYSNASTLNVRLLNSAPPFTKLSQHALILGWTISMPCLLSSVTKVYASAEAQALAMRRGISPDQPSTLWLVALSVRLHMSALVRHVASATFLLPRVTCRCHYQWPFPHLQAVPMWIAPACWPR